MSSHLSGVAMLVDFSASQWTARKVDKARSAKLVSDNRAHAKAAHVSKKLMLADPLVQISRLVTHARDNVHKKLTSPWLDNGSRILPTKLFKRYDDEMTALHEQFAEHVATFCQEDNYLAFVNAARERDVALGNLFDESDYPKPTRIEKKFGWRVTYTSLPNADDFRVDIGQAAIERVKADIEALNRQMMVEAVKNVFERALTVVTRLHDNLAGYDPTKEGAERGSFHKTALTHIEELIALMPDLNWVGDPGINTLADAMKELVRYDVTELREDNNARKTVQANAAAIVQAVSDFMA